MRKIYLDYAATTPVDPAVIRVMAPYLSQKFGNPGSLHSFGQEAIAAVDAAREIIAKSIGRPAAAGFREIIFTGSATEANNLVLRGAVKGFRVSGLGFSRNAKKKPYLNFSTLTPRVIISAIEHGSVRETVRDLEKEGVEVVEVPVNREGLVDVQKLRAALNERTVLVSVMYANNEIGVIQPIAEIANSIGEFRKEIKRREKGGESPFPLFHTDAVQAFQFLECNADTLGVDFMTLSAHKIYGPKGVGALYMGNRVWGLGFSKNGKKSTLYPNPYTLPIITGGNQEFGMRSGTENVPAIVGFAEAVRVAMRMRTQEFLRIEKMRSSFWGMLRKIYPKAEVNGSMPGHAIGESSRVLPHILNVYFPGYASEELLIKLNMCGVAVSSGPACTSRASKTSPAILALGYSGARARQSIRFSIGKYTTFGEVKTAGARIHKIFRGV